MKSHQIWNQANEHRELIRSIYHAVCEGGDINAEMNQLKQHIPCLFGIDADNRSLVFQSSDEGVVGLSVDEQHGILALAFITNIELDSQNDIRMGMQGL